MASQHLIFSMTLKVRASKEQLEFNSYWLLCSPVFDVSSMSINVDMKGVLCLCHVLLLASLALNEVDGVNHLADCCGSLLSYRGKAVPEPNMHQPSSILFLFRLEQYIPNS